MSDIIKIDDLAAPRLTEMQRAAIAGAPEIAFSVEAILGAAAAATGLSDFGPDDFNERLEIWLKSFDEDTGLNGLGRASLFGDCVRLASNRAKLEAAYRENPEIVDTPIERPLMIAGLPRSGTTHLVNILASDNRFNSLPLWESLDPISVRAGDAETRRAACKDMWGQFETLLPHMPAMHEMDPDHAHEDVELLGDDFSGYVIEWVSRAARWQAHYQSHDQTPHYAYARRILKYLNWQNGSKRWVLKSPPHMENLPALMNVYPDATVIVTHRDPVAVLQSAITMIAYGDRIRRSHIDLPELASYWIDRIEKMLRRCVRDRDILPADRSTDILFHEYMADQRAAIKRVYDLAGMEILPETQAGIDAYLEANKRGKLGRVVYDLVGDFGVDIGGLRERFSFYYDRFPVEIERVAGEQA